MEIGRRLDLLIKQSPVKTYRGFAKKARIGRPALMAILQGTSSPNIDTLERILAALDMTFADFFKSTVVRKYVNPDHQELHEMLQELLSAGGNGSIAVTENIRASYDRHMRQLVRGPK